jgi:hypothetical protein
VFTGKYFYIKRHGLFKVIRETKTLFVLENGWKFKKEAHCGGNFHYGYGHNRFGKFMTQEEFSKIEENELLSKRKSKMIGEIQTYILKGSPLFNKSFEEVEGLYNYLKQINIIP